MKKIVMVAIFLIISAANGYCQEFNVFCLEMFDGLRKMQFWGGAKILISDYESKSGDAYALKVVKGPEGYPTDSLTEYFDKEFQKILKGSHPYVNVEDGRIGRLIDAQNNYDKVHGPGSWTKADRSFNRAFEASEKERIESLYGKYPARVYCWVGIKGRTTPIIYQVKITIYDNLDVYSDGKILQTESLDYSTPKKIEGDIKKAITLNLGKLSEKLALVRDCNK